MDRRALLASATGLVASGLTGCLGHDTTSSRLAMEAEQMSDTLEMTAVADADLPPRVLYSPSPSDGSERDRLLDAVPDSEASVKATEPPLPTDEPVFYDGRVYRLSSAVTDRTPATRFPVKVDIVEGSVPNSETVRFADLPSVDRRTFAEHGLADGDTIGIGTTFLYTDAERALSALVPESDYSVIVWDDGARAEWVVDDGYETTLKTYRYTGERVASAAEYGRRMRERFAFELSGLSEVEREAVETAVSEGQYAVAPDETPTGALASLAERFEGREEVRALHETAEDGTGGGGSGSGPEGDTGSEDGGGPEGDATDEGDADGVHNHGTYLVRYDGEVYWTRLSIHGGVGRTETTR